MDHRELTEVAREICNESSDSIMQMARKLYFKISKKLSEQSWDNGIYGDDFNELWDDALFTFQSLVSSQIGNNLNDLFESMAYLEDVKSNKSN